MSSTENVGYQINTLKEMSRNAVQFIPKWNMSLTDALLLEIAKLDSKLRHAIQICSQY
jgi:hypothetical protein